MPKFTHKIEDLLTGVEPPETFEAPQVPPVADDLEVRVPFPKILDFSFPPAMPETSVQEIGEVVYVGDGVCQVAGLEQAKVDEIVEIKTDAGVEKALIFGINRERVEAVVMGDYTHIRKGDPARSTASKLEIQVGPELLSRVISPIGVPLDGRGPIKSRQKRLVEFPAPGVVERYPIEEAMHTGILAVDTTIPIGRGQRELVIGDRKTGKSRTLLDIISNQKDEKLHCIYVGVGLQAAKAKATMNLLAKRGALAYTTMVISFSDDPPSIQYIAPYVGAALGEYYMYNGQHALVIYDDLSKQAKAYRQVSLLLKRSPGRDAYPGDIFFLHSRLLERAGKLNAKLGGGSLTALPVAETQSGDISDYIITNLMSITDGHIYLDSGMMHEGLLPAINSGASVSRIGGKVQKKLLQKVGELAGRILARYQEVKSFETINTEVADDTLRDIRRGKRIQEIFSQDTDMSMTEDEEIVFLGIATSARMDHFSPDQVITFKEKFIPFYRELDSKALAKLALSAGKLEEIDKQLDTIFGHFCQRTGLPAAPAQGVSTGVTPE